MIGMSPRLQSQQQDGDGPNDNDHMNSSCKDTMKMNNIGREFSFFESVNREFGNVNAGGNRGSLGHSRQVNQFESLNMGQINDTVSRLQGLNTSEIDKQPGIFYNNEGAPCNPFISDSYLF